MVINEEFDKKFTLKETFEMLFWIGLVYLIYYIFTYIT